MNNNDRTYWRACDDKRLIEEARDSGHELCIALGERLKDCTAGESDKAETIRKLEHRLIMAQAALESMRAELGAYEEMFAGKVADND